MRRSTVAFSIVLTALLAASTPDPASSLTTEAAPRLITWQGFLATESGPPVSGALSMTFALYDPTEGGEPLWEEVHGELAVDDGVYSVILGSVDPEGNPLDSAHFTQPLWLGVTVGNYLRR